MINAFWRLKLKLRLAFLWLWSHRTKVLGMLAVAVGYGQNNLMQLGHVLPAKWTGAILAGFGVLAFLIGLYNTLANSQAPPGS